LEKCLGSARVGNFVKNVVFAQRRKTKFVISSNTCFKNSVLELGHRNKYPIRYGSVAFPSIYVILDYRDKFTL
jgi:hypothetical protein